MGLFLFTFQPKQSLRQRKRATHTDVLDEDVNLAALKRYRVYFSQQIERHVLNEFYIN